MSAQPVSMMRNAYEGYLKAGLVLVPIVSGKGPTGKGWNDREHCIFVPDQLPPDHIGVGLAHAYGSPATCALDLDDLVTARDLLAAKGVSLDALFNAPDAVGITSGNPNHAKLLFRLPFGPLPSKKVSAGKKVIFELRCGTSNDKTVQDVLPSAAIHPTSGRHYQWQGAGHWSRIPSIPVELLELWQEIITSDQRTIVKVAGELDTSWEEIQAALHTIPADCSRDDWLKAMMGLKDGAIQLGQPDIGLAIANDWSMGGGEKYAGLRDVIAVWDSISSDHPNGVTLGSLFHLAREHGWKRPVPDVRQLFASVEPVSPASIISGMIIRPPSINFDLLPPILAKRSREIGDSVGCDPLVPVMAGLGAICAAADARSRLAICEGFEVPPVLWLATIGSPSARKTPGASPMLSILNKLEREDMPRYADAMQKWTFFEAQHSAANKAFLKQAEEGLREMGDLSDTIKVPELPAMPVQKRLTIMDATSQKLLRMCADRPEGMLVVLDEMATWLGKMVSPMSGEDRSSIVQAYTAAPYSMERVGAGSIPIDNLALSIYGNIQPAIFRKYLPQLATDGFIQRFIPAALDDEKSKVGTPQPLWATSAAEYDLMIRRVHAAPAMTYYLDQVGSAMFHEFQVWADAVRARDRVLGESATMATALGKVEGTAGRLIMACHLAEAPGIASVSPGLVMRVLELVKTFIVPSMRYVYGDVGGLADDGLERWLMDHITQISDQSSVTLSDLKRSAKRQIEGMHPMVANEALRAAAAYLENLGWLVLTEDKGRSVIWAINPAIADAFKDHRAMVKRLRQEQKDNISAMITAGKAKQK